MLTIKDVHIACNINLKITITGNLGSGIKTLSTGQLMTQN